jgi:hypothetical protein
MTFKKFVIALLRPFKGRFCMTAKEMYLYSTAPSEEFEAAVVDPVVLDNHPHRIRELYGLRQNMKLKRRKVSALYEPRTNRATGGGGRRTGSGSGGYGSRANSGMRPSGMGSYHSGIRSSGSSQSFLTAHSSLGSAR